MGALAYRRANGSVIYALWGRVSDDRRNYLHMQLRYLSRGPHEPDALRISGGHGGGGEGGKVDGGVTVTGGVGRTDGTDARAGAVACRCSLGSDRDCESAGGGCLRWGSSRGVVWCPSSGCLLEDHDKQI